MTELTPMKIAEIQAECAAITKDAMIDVEKIYLFADKKYQLETKTDLYRAVRVALLRKGLDDPTLARDITMMGMLYHLNQ